MVRIAAGNGLKLQDFILGVLGGPIWEKDLDRFPDDALLRAVSDGTRVEATRSLETVFTNGTSTSVLPWVMPLCDGPRKRRLYGLQCCPACLSEPRPYFRKDWRLAFVTVCVVHGTRLLDRCTNCRRPIRINQRRQRDTEAPLILDRCVTCNERLESDRARPDDTILAAFQSRVISALKDGQRSAELEALTFRRFKTLSRYRVTRLPFSRASLALRSLGVSLG